MMATILIVDPEKLVVDLLTRALSSNEMFVLGTTSAEEATALITLHHPNLLVMDPETQNGMELLTSVVSMQASTTRVIVMTASDEVRDSVRSLNIEAAVDKSHGLDALVGAIRGLLGEAVTVMGREESVHVLVADDTDEMRMMLSAYLTRQGYTVVTAKNGREALEQVQKNPNLQVALLDVSMPEMGGLEALREIKVSAPHIGVIMMTAVNDREVAQLAVKSGAFDYILKPFTFDQIHSSINASLHRAEYEKKKSWWKW